MSSQIKKVKSSSVCRGCLAKVGEMKNMYQWKLSDIFYKITDVEVKRSEGLSELICGTCEKILKDCMKFRLQCQRSNIQLRRAPPISSQEFNIEKPKEKVKSDKSNILIEVDEKKLVYSFIPCDSDAKQDIPCPYQCKDTYSKRNTLFLHMRRVHNVSENFDIQSKYYCPYTDCDYNMDSKKNKFFLNRKYLNQHFNKVHEMKIFCEGCQNNYINALEFTKHLKSCNQKYVCKICESTYKTEDRLSVHMSRKHPNEYEQYKVDKKRKKSMESSKNSKKSKTMQDQCCDTKENSCSEFVCDSPKRSFATQTLSAEDTSKCVKNDISLAWQEKKPNKNISTSETQTVFEDALSLRSENSEEDMFFENGSLSDIQTQTWPIEFGLSRPCKIKNSSHTQTRSDSPDLSIKETQTCYCLIDSPKSVFNFSRYFDSVSSSPGMNLTSTETQTAEFSRYNLKSDVLLSFSSAQTQTTDEGKDGF